MCRQFMSGHLFNLQVQYDTVLHLNILNYILVGVKNTMCRQFMSGHLFNLQVQYDTAFKHTKLHFSRCKKTPCVVVSL